MAIQKSRIAELDKLLDIAPIYNSSRIDEIIDLYKDRKISHYKTALKAVTLLSSTSARDSNKAIKHYDKIYQKYKNAEPRDKNSANALTPTFDIIRGDYNIPQTTTTIKINKGRHMATVFAGATPVVTSELKLILTHKRSFKTKLRMEVLIRKQKKIDMVRLSSP